VCRKKEHIYFLVTTLSVGARVRGFTVALFTLSVVHSAFADAPGGAGSLLDLSLDQLSRVEIKTDIASIRAKPVEEQPGIVSVLPANEIRSTGARDLADVLMLVPGFTLDTDVESMIGLTFRGLQAQEGKALLIVNGIELNEPLYGSLPIANHLPADILKQVEIIRGPGGAQYGGTAGLSVIRVTTRDSSQNGGYVVASPGFTAGKFTDSISFGAGYERSDWRWSFNSSQTSTFLSDRDYTAVDGTTAALKRTSDVKPLYFDAALGWRGGEIKVVYDRYRYDDIINYGETVPTPNATRFDSLLALAKYEFPVSETVRIVPSFTYREQVPWWVHGSDGEYDLHVRRFQGDLTAVADLTAKSSLLLGARWQRDSVYVHDSSYYDVDPATYYYGARSVAYVDAALFAQYDVDLPWANLSIGGRYERHDVVGGSFVPRTALTKAWGKWHAKLLASQANRIPAINVLQEAIGGSLQPERTSNYELELGYQIAEGCSVSANVFYMAVKNPIVFEVLPDGANTEGYFDGHAISSAGFESELRLASGNWKGYGGYSFYRAVQNDEPYVRGDAGRFLAAPAHKLAVSSTWTLTPELDVNLNGFWLSSRLAYTADGLTDLDPELVANAYLDYHVRQFSVGLGLANAFDTERYAPQPYNGGGAPVPLPGRTVFLKLGWKF
jgi:outer membrane receptor protein involved in Fe transport